MKKLSAQVELEHYGDSELSETYQHLVSEAHIAFEGSYSPYSEFAVGAAVLLESGEIIKGANQENAAYPSGLCAERTALFFAGSNFPNEEIKAIAVAVEREIGRFPFPCGSCLQVMSEFQEKQDSHIEVLLVHPDTKEVLISKGIQNLLPFAFKKSHLSQ